MATDIQKVRVLIPDTEKVFDGDTLFSDEEISTYLEIASDNVLRAAALAVRAIATSEAMISKVITTQDLKTDGSKVADSLHKHADGLESRAQSDENKELFEYFDIVEKPDTYTPTPELTETGIFW